MAAPKLSQLIQDLVRALRLPFITASVFAYVFGALAAGQFHWAGFILGFLAVACTHLSANVLNDYADSKSGADWQDKSSYSFFGGSKLIQEKVFSEIFYLRLGVYLGLGAFLSVLSLSWLLKSPEITGYFCAILFFSLAYSASPFRFSYRMLGEVIIFVLFGPACVMGGYFIQSGRFPDLKSFLLSLPFGFLNLAILFANEVPDLATDKKCGKFNWVKLCGERNAYLWYSVICICGFASILLDIFFGYLGKIALFSLVLNPLWIKAAVILRKDFNDKKSLVTSSKLTIALQGLVSLVLILDMIL